MKSMSVTNDAESSPTRGSILTPSTTDTEKPDIFQACPPFSTTGGMGSVPEAGKYYMIRDLDSDRVITLDNGRLTLRADVGTAGGWQWCCIETPDGWLGFREKTSGKLLGRDGRGGFRADAWKFDSWEKLVLRPVQKGGYHMSAIDWWTLLRIGIHQATGSLMEVRSATEAARWEFVEV
ncbi:hypothetical protein F4861DRAFT_450310 [Xylaria intraflava]|nr:hypothetical protein F4861DRAFT_450310 [Xylaria intraflava]